MYPRFIDFVKVSQIEGVMGFSGCREEIGAPVKVQSHGSVDQVLTLPPYRLY